MDTYKIGIALALTGNVGSALGSLAREFRSTNTDAEKLKRTLGDIKLLTVAGAATLGAGLAGLGALKPAIEEAKRFEQQVARFKLFGLGDEVTREAAAYARAMNTMGTSATENMRLMVEAQGVFREAGLQGPAALEGAKLAAPVLSKIDFATESLDDESKARMRTQGLAMLRFIEMRGGLKDAGTFNGIADAGWKAIQSSGGNINWEQLRQFMARGGVAAQGLTDTALFGKLEPIIGELKGSTAGNAWMTAYNRLVGGVKVPNQIAHLLADNGIWDAKKIMWNSQGGVARFNGNPLRDMKTLSTDPVEFYEKNILPMFAKMNGGKGLDATERARENTLIFGRTGGAMFSLIDRQLATIHKSVDAQSKALGIDASTKVAGDTLNGKMVELHAQWNKLLLELGEAILPSVISVASGVIDVLKPMVAWMREHQTMTKALVIAFAGLSIMATIGGSILLFTAALRGFAVLFPLIPAITRTVAAATALPGVLTGVARGFLGTSTAAATAQTSMLGLLGVLLRMGAVGLAAHEGLKLLDPKDSMGTWIDKHIPGAAWVDNLASKVGLGSSYAQQAEKQADYDSTPGKGWALPDMSRLGPALGLDRKTPPVAPPPAYEQKLQVEVPVILDGRQVAKVIADQFYNQLNGPSSSLGGFDSRQSYTPTALASTP